MENIQDWMVSIGVLVVGGGIAWGKIHNTVQGLQNTMAGLDRNLTKLDKSMGSKFKAFDEKLDNADGRIIKNQPVINHLHDEAYKVREKLETTSNFHSTVNVEIAHVKELIKTLEAKCHDSDVALWKSLDEIKGILASK